MTALPAEYNSARPYAHAGITSQVQLGAPIRPCGHYQPSITRRAHTPMRALPAEYNSAHPYAHAGVTCRVQLGAPKGLLELAEGEVIEVES